MASPHGGPPYFSPVSLVSASPSGGPASTFALPPRTTNGQPTSDAPARASISPSQLLGSSSTSAQAQASSANETSPAGSSNHPSGSNDPAAKPTARASRACTSCNRQKLKCDGGKPCCRCVQLKVKSSCVYLPSLRGKTRKRKPADEDDGAGSDGRPGGPTQMYPHKMDSDMAMWRRDASLNHTGPAISALWGMDPPPDKVIKEVPRPPTFDETPTTSGLSPMDNYERRRHAQLAEKLTTLPLPGDAHNPLAVLAEASATANSDHDPNSPHSTVPTSKSGKVGDRAGGYYAPLERTLQDEAPHIMSFIKVHEAEQLFEMYFKYLHPHLPFLDQQHSPPSAVARRNNFLFNAICCVAARAFNIVLWERLKDFAKFEMERLPKDKNIDVVQGHLIYATWNLIRPRHFEQDMSWLRVGVAIRTAIDINLHRVALVRQARDGLPTWLLRSIIRTWLLSYIIDRTLSAQLGKPGTLRAENATRMYQKLILEGDERPSVDDVWVSALAEWVQILVRAMDVFRSDAAEHVSEDSDLISNQHPFPSLVRIFEKQFRQWREESESRAREYGPDEKSVQFLIGNVRLYDHYARLVVHSFGLQRALDQLPIDLPATFAEYQTSAIRLINGFEVDLESPGFTRGCPDFVFTVLTYAAVSILKASEPRFCHLDPHRPTLFMLARKAADMLGRAAMTPDHLPASQSVFISRLIEVKSTEPQHQPDALIPAPIDFEAFGNSLDQDTSKTLWPPMPSPSTINGLNALSMQNQMPQPQMDIGGMGNTTRARPTDLNGWVAQNQAFPVPGAALGLGVGSFLQDQDMLFTQDAFWKSILEGAQVPPNGLV